MPRYHGVVQGNTVVLPDGVHLKDGLPVEVIVPDLDNLSEAERELLWKKSLLERGVIGEIRIPEPWPDDFVPIKVEGKSLSETIIEERR